MTNRVDLDQLAELDVKEAERLPIDQIVLLLEDVAALKDRVKRLDTKLFSVLIARYADQASNARRKANKDTGTVRVEDGEFVVILDLPKRVEWDQAELRKAVATVTSWGEDPAEYVSTNLTVPEKNYTAWPATIKKVFEPARTLGVGKPTFKIERKEAA